MDGDVAERRRFVNARAAVFLPSGVEKAVMSALGLKCGSGMSALTPIADMLIVSIDVC
jgi:hypothetical protein